MEDKLGLNLTSGKTGRIIKTLLKEALHFQQLQMSEKKAQLDKSQYNTFMKAKKLTSGISYHAGNISLNHAPLVQAIKERDTAQQKNKNKMPN